MENKRRKNLSSEARNMIASVYHFLKKEYEFTVEIAKPNCDHTHLSKITQRTASATGVSPRTVARALKEERELLSSSKGSSITNEEKLSSKDSSITNKEKRIDKTGIDNSTAYEIIDTNYSSIGESNKRNAPDDNEDPGPSNMEYVIEVPIKQEIPDDTYEPETSKRCVRITKHSITFSNKTYIKKPRLSQPVIKNEEKLKDYPGTFKAAMLPSVTCKDIQMKQEPPEDIENNTVSDMNYRSCDTSNAPKESESFFVEIKKEYDTDLQSEAMDPDIEDTLHKKNIIKPQGSAAVKVEIKKEKNTHVPIDTAAKMQGTSNITIEKVKVEPQNISIEDIHDTEFSYETKCPAIDEMLNDLVKKNLLSLTDKNILAKQNLQQRLLQEKNAKVPAKLKYFAITLYVSSHKAYEHVLANFKTALPPVFKLKNWLIQPRACSGFKKEIFDVIKNKATISKPKKIFVCLDLKDVKLTKSLCETIKNKPMDSAYADARGAFVMTAVAMNAEWKLPISYFWTNVVKSSERANLVKVAITFLEEAGVEPVAVSFEYNTDNLQMCSDLKCRINRLDLETSFLSESGKPIILFPDPRGIIECVCLDSYHMNCLVDDALQVVSMTTLPLIVQNYDKAATPQQLLKKAIASEVCKYNCPSDVETSGMVTFLKNIYIVLDALSSRKGGVGFKSPVLMQTNVKTHPTVVALKKARNYFMNLRMRDTLEPMPWTTDRVRGILGLCGLIDSALMLLSKYSSELYIQFGKFINSTYFLANISISHKGMPTVQYFQREFMKMMHYVVPNKSRLNRGNNTIKQILLLKSKSPIDRINFTTNIPYNNNTWQVDDGIWKLSNGLAEYEDMFVVYIARYVANSLIEQLKCQNCVRALQVKCLEDNRIFQTRFTAKLEDPSLSVMDICKTTEAAFKKALMHGLDPQLNVPYLLVKVLKKYMDRPLFENVLHHQFDTDGTCNHLVELLRAVAKLYLETRVLLKQNRRF